jgi:hypothetical protein
VLLDRQSAHSVPQLTVITHTQFVFPSFVDVSSRRCFLLCPYTTRDWIPMATVSFSFFFRTMFFYFAFVRRHILVTDMSRQSRSSATTTDTKHVTPQPMTKEKGKGIMTTVNHHTSLARFQDAYLDKCDGETPQFRAALQSDALTARTAGGHVPAQPLRFTWLPDDDPLRTALSTLIDCFGCQCARAWGFNAATALLCVVLAMQPSLLHLWWHLPLPIWTGIGACHIVVVFVLLTKSDATGTCEACRRILHRRMQQ